MCFWYYHVGRSNTNHVVLSIGTTDATARYFFTLYTTTALVASMSGTDTITSSVAGTTRMWLHVREIYCMQGGKGVQ
jgi:hypothetical protein